MIAAARLRKGNTVCGHGAPRLIADAVKASRAAGVSAQVMVRADSGYYRQDVIAAAITAKAWFSVTARMGPTVRRAIAAISEDSWRTIKYIDAIWDHEQRRWISQAQVAEIGFTAFTSHPKGRQVPCRLVVRRVPRLNPPPITGQGELFTMWRLAHVRRLTEIAAGRGQKLDQMALLWALRDHRVASAVIGASSVEQLDTNLDALQGPPLTDTELAAIDHDAVEAGINLWAEMTKD